MARKIFLSAASASSKARTLDSRPTTNGVIMKGKMTTSRMGIMGSFLDSNFSLDVVTESPWDNGQTTMLQEFYLMATGRWSLVNTRSLAPNDETASD